MAGEENNEDETEGDREKDGENGDNGETVMEIFLRWFGMEIGGGGGKGNENET